MSRKYGNRYSSGGLRLTDREARTLKGCIDKMLVIAKKEGRYGGERNKLFNVVSYLTMIIEDADRKDVL